MAWPIFELRWINEGLSETSEHKLYQGLLALSPGLEERLNTGSDNDISYVADMVRTPARLRSDLPCLTPTDIKGDCFCSVRRYEVSQVGDCRLDHTLESVPHSPIDEEREDGQRLPPP